MYDQNKEKSNGYEMTMMTEPTPGSRLMTMIYLSLCGNRTVIEFDNLAVVFRVIEDMLL